MPNHPHRPEHHPPLPELHPALELLPRGIFIITASHEGRRLGLRVHFVQTAATEPPSISVALPKGQPISPLIRDARAFGICITTEQDTSLARRFALIENHPDDNHQADDPFEPFEPFTLTTGAPFLPRAAAALDCRVTMHLDVETDHELYIAEVVDARIADPPTAPALRTGPLPPSRRHPADIPDGNEQP